jgi:hypothetical protein
MAERPLFYVYELVDPRTDKVFYVGKGKNNRIDQHEIEARKGRQSRKCNVIRGIEKDGLSVKKRKVSYHVCEQEAYDAEAELICRYGLDNLTNVVPGGPIGIFGIRIGPFTCRQPSIYEDRRVVVELAKLLRTYGRQIKGDEIFVVCGVELHNRDILASLGNIVLKVAKRRSFEWMNDIAQRYNVTFAQAV